MLVRHVIALVATFAALLAPPVPPVPPAQHVAKPSTITGDVRTLRAVTGDAALAIAPRDVLVWLPPGYDDEASRARRYPVVYMMDGQNCFDAATSFAGEWRADETATKLITSHAIEPVIIVAVPNSPQRIDEYTVDVHGGKDGVQRGGKGAAFIAYLCDAVKPQVDSAFRTMPGRESTAIVGSSLGGLLALSALECAPQTFGRAAAFSPSLWWADEALVTRWTNAKVRPSPLRLWIDMGTREGGDEAPKHAARVRALAALFGDASHVKCVVVQGGEHNEAAWSARFGEALLFLFPKPQPEPRREPAPALR